MKKILLVSSTLVLLFACGKKDSTSSDTPNEKKEPYWLDAGANTGDAKPKVWDYVGSGDKAKGQVSCDKLELFIPGNDLVPIHGLSEEEKQLIDDLAKDPNKKEVRDSSDKVICKKA